MGPWGWLWMLIWIAALLFMVWLIVRGAGTSDDESPAHS